MREDLPKGWAMSPVSRVATVNPRHPRELNDKVEVSFAPMACLSESSPTMDGLTHRPLGQVRTGFTHFAEGDVLFAKITPCMENGKGAVALGLKNGLGCGTTELHVLRPTELIDATYLYHFTHQPSFRKRAEARFTGSAGQARVPVAFFNEAEIPVPPISEQRRIVTKLEALLSKLDASRKRLERIPVILKRFRQAILAAACDGRLTEDWRQKNPSPENAETLLRKMQVERKTIWETKHQRRRYVSPEPMEETDLSPIPESWVWSNFDQCSWEITVGHVGPMRDRYIPEGRPFLRSQNVRPLRFDPTGLVFIPEDFHRALSKSALYGGEILVVRSGANTGDCCVFQKVFGVANCSDLVVARPLSGLLSDYGAAYVASPKGRAHLAMNETGNAQPHFNIGAMRVKPFPLPPMAEQQEIVKRISQLFAFADQVEARYAKAKAQIDRLTPSILAKAFRGELVPQDPHDEPAAALLHRLKANPAEATTPKGRGRPRKTAV